ncbi:MAG: muramoyltetrapeptide carboxypeptidase [Candidatus Sumerlaeota bacterium]|nr:muramoyltetrapeptide carboxypeptidase [Candidatus Sumerlaeota bacterium]
MPRLAPFAFALLLPLLLVLAGCESTGNRPSLVKPHALMPGDTIAFVAPAKWRPEEALQAAENALAERGYKVKRYPQIESRYGYLAGSDEERAAALMDAFRDPEIDAILPVTGGYGLTRILDRLDWEVIRANPKIVMGYSDLTALHIALEQRAGVVGFHSPFPTWMYAGKDGPAAFTEDSLWRALEAARYPADEQGYLIDPAGLSRPVETLVPGVARGRLTGGNLSLITALMGTPYEIDTRGALLFIEEVGEDPYRVDRMFSTLAMSGKLAQANGIVIGVFRGCEPDEPEISLTVEQLFEEYLGGLGVPVVVNFPVGHVGENATLPVGILAELDADSGTIRLLENPVELGVR